MAIIKIENIENLIIDIRNEKVILDSDLAKIYGVETRDINKSVKNNPEKFPKGYVIQLSEKELANLRWKNSTTKLAKTSVSPKAFTEKGLYGNLHCRFETLGKNLNRFIQTIEKDLKQAASRKKLAARNK